MLLHALMVDIHLALSSHLFFQLLCTCLGTVFFINPEERSGTPTAGSFRESYWVLHLRVVLYILLIIDWVQVVGIGMPTRSIYASLC